MKTTSQEAIPVFELNNILIDDQASKKIFRELLEIEFTAEEIAEWETYLENYTEEEIEEYYKHHDDPEIVSIIDLFMTNYAIARSCRFDDKIAEEKYGVNSFEYEWMRRRWPSLSDDQWQFFLHSIQKINEQVREHLSCVCN